MPGQSNDGLPRHFIYASAHTLGTLSALNPDKSHTHPRHASRGTHPWTHSFTCTHTKEKRLNSDRPWTNRTNLDEPRRTWTNRTNRTNLDKTGILTLNSSRKYLKNRHLHFRIHVRMMRNSCFCLFWPILTWIRAFEPSSNTLIIIHFTKIIKMLGCQASLKITEIRPDYPPRSRLPIVLLPESSQLCSNNT